MLFGLDAVTSVPVSFVELDVSRVSGRHGLSVAHRSVRASGLYRVRGRSGAFYEAPKLALLGARTQYNVGPSTLVESDRSRPGRDPELGRRSPRVASRTLVRSAGGRVRRVYSQYCHLTRIITRSSVTLQIGIRMQRWSYSTPRK